MTDYLPTLNRLKEASRFIMFETPFSGYEVATNCGTLFLVELEGTPYGLTARHNLHDFRWSDLLVTDHRFGTKTASLRAVHCLQAVMGAAVGSDLSDLAIVCFSEAVNPAFFGGSAFDISQPFLALSDTGDDLLAYGNIAEASHLDNNEIHATFAELGFRDVGPNADDVVLRDAEALWDQSHFKNLAGMSGGPVFNLAKGGLSGMMIRGGVTGPSTAKMYYIDIADIIRVLHAVHDNEPMGAYIKIVERSS
jgi:hypothetical protein